MWHLQQQWKQNREKLARLEDQQRNEGMNISEERFEEARRQIAWDEDNAAAITLAEANKQAQADADRQRTEEQRLAQARVAQDTYKRLARQQWPGDDASFDSAWPQLLQQWQIRQTTEQVAVAASGPRVRL